MGDRFAELAERLFVGPLAMERQAGVREPCYA